MIDIRTYGAVPDGTTDCAGAINAALLVGDVIIQNGIFLISQSIKIPSNRTVYGKNAKLKLADNSFDNLLTNSDFANGNTNVNIIGLGNFCLDANGTNNSDAYATYGKRGEFSYKYVGVKMFKVSGFQLKNLTFIDTPHHCVHINKSHGSAETHSIIDNIYFNFKTQALNQDGLDIMWGSSYIDISNIQGKTADDFIILFAGVNGDLLPDYSTGFNVGDVHHITISNYIVKDSANGRFPSICAGNGNKIHDITLNNMKALSSGAFIFSNYGAEFTGTLPSVNDVYNITGDNIQINYMGSDAACFIFGQSIKDSAFTNVVNNSGKLLYQKLAGTQQNVSINGSVI